MSLSHRIAEIPAAVTKLEDELPEAGDYPERVRGEASFVLSDLAARLELARLNVLDPGADDPETAA